MASKYSATPPDPINLGVIVGFSSFNAAPSTAVLVLALYVVGLVKIKVDFDSLG